VESGARIDKTCKTTLALSFPKPLVVMEFDIGGFDRAKYRFKDDVNSGTIKYEAYPIPVGLGAFDPSKLELRPSKIIIGMKELFYQWALAYIKHLQDPNLATIVIDTATLLYSIDCDCFLQEKQELQLDPKGNVLPGERLRVQLSQVEYKEPNTRMRGIIYNAKKSGKHLVMTHHARDKYGPVLQKDGSIAQTSTGKRERAGFSTLGDSADLIVHTYTKPQPILIDGKPIMDGLKQKTHLVPFCDVELAGVLELVGMTFMEPTYDKIATTIQMIRGG